VRNEMLDISVFDNDDFDLGKSQQGKDRWLYFRYTLEIDPVVGTAPKDYVASISALLKSLWSSQVDAIGACDFEEYLPRNVRRLELDRTPQTHGTGGEVRRGHKARNA